MLIFKTVVLFYVLTGAIEAVLLNGTCYNDATPLSPTLSTTVATALPTTADSCIPSCAASGFAYAATGATGSGSICACGTATADATLVAATNSTQCLQPGAADGFYNVYLTGIFKLTFLNASVAASGTNMRVATVTAVTDLASAVVTYDFGDSRGNTTSNVNYYTEPGDYVITVAATQNSEGITLFQTLTFSWSLPSKPLVADCPPIAEYGSPYGCRAAVLGRNFNISIGYSTESTLPYKGLDATWVPYGNSPPKDSTFISTGAISSTSFNVTGAVIRKLALADSVEYWANQTGTFTLEFSRAVCPAGDELCYLDGLCHAIGECPSLDGATCSSSQFFQIGCPASPVSGFCASSVNEICPVLLGNFPSYTPYISVPITIARLGYNFYDLSSMNLWLEPGLVVTGTCAAQGCIGFLDSPRPVPLLQVNAVEVSFVNLNTTCSDSANPISFTVNSGGAVTLTNTTKCLTPVILDWLSLTPNVTINATTIAVQSLASLTVSSVVFQGNQFFLTLLTGDGNNVTQAAAAGALDVTAQLTYGSPGVFTLNASVYNEMTLIKTNYNNVNNTRMVTVVVQAPVVPTWSVQTTSSSYISGSPATVNLVRSATYPSGATVRIDWGDGSLPQELSLDSLGGAATSLYPLNWTYSKTGIYNVQVSVYNLISSQNATAQLTVLSGIVGLDAVMTYQSSSGAYLSGFGASRSNFPANFTVRFDFTLVDGTVDYFQLSDTVTGLVVDRVNVTNPFNPAGYSSSQIFSEEGLYNLSLSAYNGLQPSGVTVYLVFNITGQLDGLEVSDFQIVTSPNQTKWFQISFASLGAGTCVTVDFGDGSLPSSYGDRQSCSTFSPGAQYDATVVMDTSINITHVYQKYGQYNVTVEAQDFRTYQETMLPIVVTTLKGCKPPTVFIVVNSTDFQNPLVFNRSQEVTLTGRGIIECNLTQNTKKEWGIYRVNESTGLVLEEIDIKSTIYSWNFSSLFIPKRFLAVGLYKIVYFLTIYDPPVLDPSLPMMRLASSFVRIQPSALVPMILESSASRIVRGPGQSIQVAADQWSFDPDDPLIKSFTYKWYCHRLTPSPETIVAGNTNQPIVKNSVDNGGCFGYGPGYLSKTTGSFGISADAFIAVNATYRITLFLDKDVRESSTYLDVDIVAKPVPIISIRCQNILLCYPTNGGAHINRRNRLGLVGSCDSNCSADSVYDWYLEIYVNGAYSRVALDGYASGLLTSEIAIDSALFEMYASVDVFRVGLELTSPTSQQKGLMEHVLHVNEAPSGGSCSINSTSFYALIDTVVITCDNWTDPENIGIHSFTYYVLPSGSILNETLRLTLRTMVVPSPAPVVLSTGTHDLYVDIKDAWDGLTTYSIATLTVTMPSEQQFKDYLASNALKVSAGAGDSELLAMRLSALMDVQNNAPFSPLATNSTSNVSADTLIQMTEQKLSSLQMLKENIAFGSLAELESGSAALSAVLNGTSLVGQTSLTLSSNVRSTAMDIIEQMNRSLENVSVATPSQLLPFVANMMDAMSSFVKGVTNILSENNPYFVPPADVAVADTWFYDTDMGDDPFMEVPKDPELQLRGNVLDTTRSSSVGDISTLMDISLNLHKKVLGAMVAGEQYQFASPSGVVFTSALLPSESYLNATFNFGDSGASATFPPNFCPYSSGAGTTATVSSTTSFSLTSPSTMTSLNRTVSTTASPSFTTVMLTTQNPLPEVKPECRNKSFAMAATVWPVLTRSEVPTARLLSPDSYVIDLDIMDRKLSLMNVNNLDPPLGLKIPRNPVRPLPVATGVNTSEAVKQWPIPVAYSMFNVTSPDVTLHVEVTPGSANQSLVLLISHERMPTLQRADHTVFVPSLEKIANDTFRYSLPTSGTVNSTGRYFIGILEVSLPTYPKVPLTAINQPSAGAAYNPLGSLTWINLTADYTLRVSTSGCYYFDPSQKIWSTNGLTTVSGDSRLTTCQSTHLSSFGSGFFVPPNTVDFAYVFAHASFADNVTIYMTIIVTLSVYFVLLIWARIQDRKDVEKLGATPLPDNKKGSKYLYEILVFTADKADAATDSRVQFMISGDEDDSGVRSFGDPQRKLFRKGATDCFVMAVPRRLGNLTYLRIWHDNSGEGRYGSWYLNYIVFRDVQTGEKYIFIGNCWFALEEGDGKIDRLLPVAGKEQITEFRHLFATTSSKKLRDGHLWFSVFLRPPRSRFTRVERLSSCVALLYLAMLVNAMWYGTVPEKGTSTNSFSLGPIKMSTEQIGVGIMSDLIVFPPSFLIVLFFRKSRPRRWRPSRILQALGPDNLPSTVQTRPKKRPFLLPWWCRYIAWILVIAAMGVSVFFLWAYGIQFGNEKTTKWLTSLVISFFTSVLFVQPIKVVLTALFMSAVCRSMETDIDDADIDEEEPANLAEGEEFLHSRRMAVKKKQPAIHAFDQAYLEKLRELRIKEVKMWEVIRNVGSYLVFLFSLMVISYYNRDPACFSQKDNIEKVFVTGPKFDQMTTQNDLWTWVQEGLVPNLQAGMWYNGKSPYGQRGFLADRVNRILGYATMRQIRVKPDTCKVHAMMVNISQHCSRYSNYLFEDQNHYCSGWTNPTLVQLGVINNTGNLPVNCSLREFRYTKASELQELPLVGTLDAYGGGGYVIRMRGSKQSMLDTVGYAAKTNWIDHRTRAVIVYFSVYNVQVNLFSLVTLMAEFSPSGNIVPTWNIEVVRLITEYSGSSVILLACQIIYVIFIIYFTYRELRRICKDGRQYFKRYWSYAELGIIIISYVAIGLYLVRFFITQKSLKIFEETWGNGYVNMRYASAMDFAYSYCVAALAFLSILKFLQLLDYNPRMSILSSTLRVCAPDLLGFSVVFVVILVAFAWMFSILVGANVYYYCSLWKSIMRLFSMMLGVFDFPTLRDNSRLAPVLFAVFTMFTSNVVLNVLFTLINSAFGKVREEIDKQQKQLEIFQYIAEKIKEVVGLNRNNKVAPVKETRVNNRVLDLPSKVDQLIDGINSVYFSGQMDMAPASRLKRY